MNLENIPVGEDDYARSADFTPANPGESIWAKYARAELTTLPDGRTVKLDIDGNIVNYPFFLVD